MWLKRRKGESRGINNLDIRLQMGHTWLAKGVLHRRKRQRQRVGLVLGLPSSVVGTWRNQRRRAPRTFRPFFPQVPRPLLFLAITRLGRDWLFSLADHATCTGMSARMALQTNRRNLSRMWQSSQGQRFTGCST
jgi:hypothetical protein